MGGGEVRRLEEGGLAGGGYVKGSSSGSSHGDENANLHPPPLLLSSFQLIPRFVSHVREKLCGVPFAAPGTDEVVDCRYDQKRESAYGERSLGES